MPKTSKTSSEPISQGHPLTAAQSHAALPLTPCTMLMCRGSAYTSMSVLYGGCLYSMSLCVCTVCGWYVHVRVCVCTCWHCSPLFSHLAMLPSRKYNLTITSVLSSSSFSLSFPSCPSLKSLSRLSGPTVGLWLLSWYWYPLTTSNSVYRDYCNDLIKIPDVPDMSPFHAFSAGFLHIFLYCFIPLAQTVQIRILFVQCDERVQSKPRGWLLLPHLNKQCGSSSVMAISSTEGTTVPLVSRCQVDAQPWKSQQRNSLPVSRFTCTVPLNTMQPCSLDTLASALQGQAMEGRL